jgi:hypothetical protein
MAGEWIQIDCNLATKPEIEELIDLTGEDRYVIVGRIVGFWAWAGLNADGGTARMTMPRLCRMFGGTPDFWQAVESVGWLEFGQDGQTVGIPGWERRFSKSAKTRANNADRAAASRDGAQQRTGACAQAHGAVRESALELGELGELEEVPPPPPRESFAKLRELWNQGPGAKWTPHKPPKGTDQRLAEPGWFEQVPAAIKRLRVAKYFDTPVTLIQFVMPGFVDRLLGGQYDAEKPAKRAAGPPRPDDKPPPKTWTGADEEARKRMIADLKRKLEAVA